MKMIRSRSCSRNRHVRKTAKHDTKERKEKDSYKSSRQKESKKNNEKSKKRFFFY